MSEKNPYVVRNGSRDSRELCAGIHQTLSVTGQQMTISRLRLEPGAILPEHDHPHEQLGILLSGRMRMTIGAWTAELGPGDVWRIPGDVRHSVEALDQAVEALDIFYPVREDYRHPDDA